MDQILLVDHLDSVMSKIAVGGAYLDRLRYVLNHFSDLGSVRSYIGRKAFPQSSRVWTEYDAIGGLVVEDLAHSDGGLVEEITA